jgi:hypothetical protein
MKIQRVLSRLQSATSVYSDRLIECVCVFLIILLILMIFFFFFLVGEVQMPIYVFLSYYVIYGIFVSYFYVNK